MRMWLATLPVSVLFKAVGTTNYNLIHHRCTTIMGNLKEKVKD